MLITILNSKLVNYANGEYEHNFSGIVEYYRKEYAFKDFLNTIAVLKTALYGIKYKPNNKCPNMWRPQI